MGGSPPGRIKKIERDFQGSFQKLEKQYFNGESSTYTEEQFERRFRVPRVVFAEVWGKVEGKGPFKQHYDCVTAKPGIHPLVRMVACWRQLSYGDASDRSDENKYRRLHWTILSRTSASLYYKNLVKNI